MAATMKANLDIFNISIFKVSIYQNRAQETFRTEAATAGVL